MRDDGAGDGSSLRSKKSVSASALGKEGKEEKEGGGGARLTVSAAKATIRNAIAIRTPSSSIRSVKLAMQAGIILTYAPLRSHYISERSGKGKRATHEAKPKKMEKAMIPASEVPALIQTKMSIPEARQLGFTTSSALLRESDGRNAHDEDRQRSVRICQPLCYRQIPRTLGKE